MKYPRTAFLTITACLVLTASPVFAAKAISTGCMPQDRYPQALGVRALDEQERQRIKGNAWYRGNVLYLDIYNGNRDLTLNGIEIQIIPATAGIAPRPSAANENPAAGHANSGCKESTDFYGQNSYHLTVDLPPLAATHQRVKMTGIAAPDQFTWKILRAEGYPTYEPYPWQLWR